MSIEVSTTSVPLLPAIPQEEELTEQMRWRLGHAEALVSLYRTAFSDINALDVEVDNNANTASNHYANTSNPHSVNKTQVGLGNVTDDSQLKRTANDFNSFTAKTTLVANDIVLIEDSAANYVKKKVTRQTLHQRPGQWVRSLHQLLTLTQILY